MAYKCKKHNKTSYYIDVKKNSQQRIVCQACILENKMPPENLKDINKILGYDPSSNLIFSEGGNQ